MPSLTLESVARAISKESGFDFQDGIAEGSFKETYLVKKSNGASLALKILKPGASPERSSREVEAMKRCSHSNIAGLVNLAEFEHSGQKYVYLIEEFMEGGTLEDRLKGVCLDRDVTLSLGEALISAIEQIAKNDLVHRDLKPANIMFRKINGDPVIVDFGIVRDLRKTSLTNTYLGMGPGTPFFAPPEQLNNEKALIGWRSDEFALGVVLSMAHLGFHPYAEPGDDPVRVVGRVAAREGPAARFQESVAASRLPVVAKMVASWPVSRIRTPEALLDAWRQQRERK
jgi:serine/threonine protein kinase